ncbi:hypothetical protein PHSC3_001257 [Chlamydiales bacterium STE3]|nr:hypothetical protein PHSC3_001257 [Chlamydiales bacterium STE3]
MKLLSHIFICLFALTLALYTYIDHLNKVIEERLKIPILKKELREIKEKNTLLQYEVDRFESPSHLMELVKRNEYSHLKFPINSEITVIEVR